jgi:hypothetical protein
LQRLRFELWGQGVGLPSGSIDGEEVIPYNTDLDKSRVQPVIQRALENVRNLLHDVAAVDGRYGVTIATSDEGRTTLRGTRIFQIRFDRLKERIRKGQKDKSIRSVTRWALHDGEKFKNTVQRLTEFIDNLHKVTTELGLFKSHLEELRIHAEIRNISNEEDLETLADATSKHSESSIHRIVTDAASRRLSVVTASILGETRTHPHSTASTYSFHTAKTKPSEHFLDTVEEIEGELSVVPTSTRAISARSCAECIEIGEFCSVVDEVVACVSCITYQKQCSFDVGTSVLGSRVTSVDSEVQSMSLASTPQHERLLAESASRSLAIPQALSFEGGDEHHGDHISAIQDADFDYWIGNVDKLALQAHQSTSTAKRMWYELRTINKAKIPFISATPIADDLGKILASIEGPPKYTI